MNVTDAEMVRQLTLRDGPISARSLPHSAAGACRYGDLYPDRDCPWCKAEARRVAREGGIAATQR